MIILKNPGAIEQSFFQFLTDMTESERSPPWHLLAYLVVKDTDHTLPIRAPYRRVANA